MFAEAKQSSKSRAAISGESGPKPEDAGDGPAAGRFEPRRPFVLASLIGLAAAAIVATIALQALLAGHERSTRAILAEAIEQPRQESIDIFQSVVDLGRIADPPCSAAFLDKVRAIGLRSAAVKDIIYQQDGRPACSGLGWPIAGLKFPTSPDIVGEGGFKLWFSVSTPGGDEPTAKILDTGRFFLLLREDAKLAGTLPPFRRLTRVRIGEGGRPHMVSGPDLGLSAAQFRQGSTLWTSAGLVVPACLPYGWNCYALLVEPGGLLGDDTRWVVAAIAGSALFGLLCAAVLYHFVAKRRSLPSRIQRALSRNEFVVHYQPIYDTRQGRFVGAEALLRWPQKDGSYLPPDRFIPAAERAGLIGALTLTVLRQMTERLGAALRTRRDFSISLNVCANDLVEPQFMAALDTYIGEGGILPDQISLEITERELIDAELGASRTLKLHELGYHIQIDDFGTGYANLAYLGDLAVDGVKIDRSFTSHIDDGSPLGRIVPSILAMADELELTVIAEGVETEAQMIYLMDRGVTLMQGFLFARPMPAQALLQLCLTVAAPIVAA